MRHNAFVDPGVLLLLCSVGSRGVIDCFTIIEESDVIAKTAIT